MNYKILSKVIHYYITNNTNNLIGEETLDIRIALEEKLIADIRNEIISSEEENLKVKIKNQIKTEQEKKQLLEMKSLLWEGFFLAFLLGILVNEVSVVLDIFKGIPVINLTVTLIIILIFTMLTVLLYNFKYTKDLIRSYNNRNGEVNGKQ